MGQNLKRGSFLALHNAKKNPPSSFALNSHRGSITRGIKTSPGFNWSTGRSIDLPLTGEYKKFISWEVDDGLGRCDKSEKKSERKDRGFVLPPVVVFLHLFPSSPCSTPSLTSSPLRKEV